MPADKRMLTGQEKAAALAETEDALGVVISGLATAYERLLALKFSTRYAPSLSAYDKCIASIQDASAHVGSSAILIGLANARMHESPKEGE